MGIILEPVAITRENRVYLRCVKNSVGELNLGLVDGLTNDPRRRIV